MPEPSARDREKAAQLEPRFAAARLVEALERGWEIHFRCQYCGATSTWGREVMLGKARRYLNCTMCQIQARVPCPRCPGRRPAMWMSGVVEPTDVDRRKWATAAALFEAGLNPAEFGYGWRQQG